MTTREKIEKLARLCKSSVYITYNEHTSNYESVEAYVRRSIEGPGGNFEEEKPDDLPEMIMRGKVVEVQFYPHTPIGSYGLIGLDIDKLLDEALVIAERESRV